ncbi:hypothetical protein CYMTET_56447 [Cymbomonas tetramitiformis]|uniref:Uncharacterized protein n=1 Tax=Cymbomonas tetramitiformis TaxID=36881 RepID=A0AAE0ELY5_9CHLO|nr:hypothetical protein CYMTET_56447 [Cymbomonas tetramitiformis]
MASLWIPSIFNQWLQEFDASNEAACCDEHGSQAAKAAIRFLSGGCGEINAELEAASNLTTSPSNQPGRGRGKSTAGASNTACACWVDVPGASPPGYDIPFRDRAEGASSSPEERTAKEGSLACSSRHQRRGVAVGLSWSKNQLAARISKTVPPRRFTLISVDDAADLVEDIGAALGGKYDLSERENSSTFRKYF